MRTKVKNEDKNYIIEKKQYGNFLKISAIDPLSLKEVSIIGPVDAPKEYLEKMVIQKLELKIKAK